MSLEVPVDYLSGPMSGKPYFNIPVFDAAAKRLRASGRKVISPAELDDPIFRSLCLLCATGDIQELQSRCKVAGIEPATWGDLLARDIKLLANDGIENIVCLPGWTKSQGARGETFFGRLLNLNILSYPTLNPVAPHALQAAHGIWFGDGGSVVPPCYHEPGEIVTWEGRKDALGGELAEFSKQQAVADNLARERREGPSKGEVRVTDPETGGEKGEKPEAFDLLPWEALDEVARLYHRGAKKYEPNNWRKGFRWGLCFASLIRHAHAFWRGESLDPETKCHHLASVAFHALTLIEFEKHNLGTDDRP